MVAAIVMRPRARAPATIDAVPSPIPVSASQPAARYVGRAACAECHAHEDQLWRGSHHDLAMQEATAKTVLGNFDDAQFDYFGTTSRFYRKGTEFWVQTDGPDGQPHDYQIAYTFGIYPLQQYLIAFTGGRFQALNVCWDTRPKDQGGQRWFHLYPDDNVGSDDVLHWTGPYQNWNHMCAECHSTGVQKGYSPANDSFRTTLSELNVSCEACHGPGSEHVRWADATKQGRRDDGDPLKGLMIALKQPKNVAWVMDPDKTIARRDPPLTTRTEMEVCARCHSRRGKFSEDYVHGKPLMDTHRPALLEASLYEPDGQILDEVFEYQSFLQSKMYAAGVTCTDCHNAHSLTMPSGNGLCASCHLPDKYDVPAHHFHKPDSTGAQCVACHVATKNYMVVHTRHDHSFRVPRPDLTLKIGTRNACNQCHTDQSAQWAADATAKWWGTKRAAEPHLGEALHAGTEHLPGAADTLAALAADASHPSIFRASAVAQFADYLGPAVGPVVQRALGDEDPMVRAAAISAVRDTPADVRARLLAPLLADPVRMVRIDATRALAAVPDQLLPPEQAAARARGMDEYRIAQYVDADRAESHLNLGALHVELGELEQAHREYQIAIKLSPRFPPSYVNLADLYRLIGKDDDAVRTLEAGLQLSPNSADLHHALGLALARTKRLPEALDHLARAVELSKQRLRYVYVYGVALNSVGRGDEALAVLKAAHERHSGDPELLMALATISRDRGDRPAAIVYARKLTTIAPNDPASRQLLSQLESEQR